MLRRALKTRSKRARHPKAIHPIKKGPQGMPLYVQSHPLAPVRLDLKCKGTSAKSSPAGSPGSSVAVPGQLRKDMCPKNSNDNLPSFTVGSKGNGENFLLAK